MSLWGTIHQFLGGVLQVDADVNREVISTGNLLPEKGAGFQRCHLFRSEEFRGLLLASGLSVEFMSASNSLSTGRAETLTELDETDAGWEHLIEMELEACRDPGCLGLGSHLIAVCRAGLGIRRTGTPREAGGTWLPRSRRRPTSGGA